MMTPTGSSEGSIAMRPTVSQPTTMIPPNSAEAGIRNRLSEPITIRTICGAMSPTKPSSPATLTADAASSAATEASLWWTVE